MIDENWYMVCFSPLIMNINFENSFSSPILLKIAPKVQNLVLLMTEKLSMVPDWKLRNDRRCQIKYWETINVQDWKLRNDQRCKFEYWEMINNVVLWSNNHFSDLALLIISQYLTLHHWSFLSFQFYTIYHFSVGNLALLIVSQFSILHHWSYLSFQSGTINHFSVIRNKSFWALGTILRGIGFDNEFLSC